MNVPTKPQVPKGGAKKPSGPRKSTKLPMPADDDKTWPKFKQAACPHCNQATKLQRSGDGRMLKKTGVRNFTYFPLLAHKAECKPTSKRGRKIYV